MEIDFSKAILAAKKGKAPLNKPFRLPSGSKKKFGVYVKNDKGNIVKVTFGDPNMSIKRDNPERRKAYRARHGCDNPGPKYKANYWSCKMWSAKPVSKITGSEEEITLEVDIQAKNKGLWYNIQQKKKRMGKNYRPAPVGSPDRPSPEALKKAQGSDYENENYEWDGETEFDQIVFLKADQSLVQVDEIEEGYTIQENFNGCPFAVVEEGEIDQCFDTREKAQRYIDLDKEEEMLKEESKMPMEMTKESEEELKDYKNNFYEMIVGSINSIKSNAENILNKLNDPMVKENLTEPFLQQMAALAEDYMITIHNFVMFNKEDESVAQMTGPINDYVSKESKKTDNWSTPINEYAQSMFKVGDKVRNINPYCKHYGSEGEVKEIRDLPEDMGYAVIYECSNDGSSWIKGDMLGKTEIQLQKISEAKWSKEYKDSIDCKNPKGFSQRAHCQSLKKK
jgi:hypothetical protein